MSLFDSLLAHLGALPTQNARLIRLHTPLGPDALVAETLDVDEAIGPLPDNENPFGLSLSKPIDAPPTAGTRLIVHALSGSTYLDADALAGQPVLVELLTAHSTTALRPWHGHITDVELVGSDGGLARYRLVIEPWLAALAHRQDSYVFHDQTVIEIIDELFTDYQGQGTLTPQWRWDLADSTVYPKRSLSRQHQESDLTYLHRLLREEGLFYWWEHSADAIGPGGQHTLVIADHNGAFPAARQAQVRYTQSGATLSEDSLTRLASQAAVHPTRLELASADYRSLDLRALSTNTSQGSASTTVRPPFKPGAGSEPVEGQSTTTAPGLDTLTQRDVPSAYAYEDSAQGQRLLQRQSEALDAQRHQFHTTGSVRTAAAGTTFTLSDHTRHDGLDTPRDQFVILRAQHHARNNLHADHAAQVERVLGPLPDRLGSARAPRADATPEPTLLHHCNLLLQPAALPVRCCNALHASSITAPTRALPDVRLNPRPSVHGLYTALVIGLADDAVHSDRDQRIKVQFHWQRGARSQHRLDHPSGADNAPGDASGVASSGTWLRVATPIAGANWGGHFTPRLGQEVLVAFHDGDIDRAVVVGSAYNGQGQVDAPGNQSASAAAPAWFQGEKDSTHPAALSGLKSQELPSSQSGTGGYNHLVFDDSPKAERIELGTSQAGSRLQLGRLTYQQDNQLGASATTTPATPAARGHGAELATQAWGALRAGGGLLLSSHGYTGSTGGGNGGGQQLDARPAQARLQQGHELLHTLAQSAQAHNAKLAGEAALGDTVPDPCNASNSLPVERGLAATQTSLAEEQTLGGSDSSSESVRAEPVEASPVEGQSDEAPATEAPAIGGGQGRVPAWGRPDLVLASPAGILQSSPASGLLSVGQTTAFVAGHDLNQISQGSWSLTAKDGIVLYTYGQVSNAKKPNQETGIQLHAARGNVSSQSQTGATRLIADQNISLSSTQADIKAASPTTFLLTAGGAGITLTGGQITLTASGNITLKAGQKILAGGGSVNAGSLTFPRTTLLLNPTIQAKYPISL